MSKIYSQQVAKVQALVAGLNANAALVKAKGIDYQFIKKLDAENNAAAGYNMECEKQKAELKLKVGQANAQLDEVKKMARQAKKIIKMNFDKSRWQEFGVADLR